MTSITIYDGANTIGGTKIFFEEKGKGIFLDFSPNFIDFCQTWLRYGKGTHLAIHNLRRDSPD